MAKKKKTLRAYVELTAYWCYDDAQSTIKVSRRRWQQIQDGATYVKSAWAWYEGSRFSMTWSFSDGQVTIDGENGTLEIPVSELFAHVWPEENAGRETSIPQ